MPGLQHPLCPPPETTFNSPGGLRCSSAGGQRDRGCRAEGGAQEQRLPQCASSFLGAERAALSSRFPPDCSPDVTHPPPGGGAVRRVGCGEQGLWSVNGSVSVCARVPRKTGNRLEPQLDPATSQKLSSLQTSSEGLL